MLQYGLSNMYVSVSGGKTIENRTARKCVKSDNSDTFQNYLTDCNDIKMS